MKNTYQLMIIGNFGETHDRDVIKFLKMFTEIEIKKIETIKDKDINELKILACSGNTLGYMERKQLKILKSKKNQIK